MHWLNDINWFAVHAKRFRETLAAGSVGALGFEVFLPMMKVDCPGRQVIKVASKALFPGYFFARFNPEISLAAVQGARGVLQVVKFGFYPIPVENHIIREIQERMEGDGLIHLRRDQLKPGDRVSVQTGPFEGMMGRVETELEDHQRVAILMETLWNARLVIEKAWLQLEPA